MYISAYKKICFYLPHFPLAIINDIKGCSVVVAVNKSWSAKRLRLFVFLVSQIIIYCCRLQYM
jgi:hypothetical protein